MFYIATLFAFATLWGFSCTSARPSTVYLVDKGIPHNIGLLNARQSGTQDVPSQCESTCDATNAMIANCTPQACCTASFETQIYNCLICVGSALNVTDYSDAQMVINGLEQQCAAVGLSIPSLFLPGQGGSSSMRSTISTVTGVTPTSITSATDSMLTSLAPSSSSISTELHTLSVPPLTKIAQQTVTVASTTTSASTTTPVGNGAVQTLRNHVSCVCAIIVIMSIGYF